MTVTDVNTTHLIGSVVTEGAFYVDDNKIIIKTDKKSDWLKVDSSAALEGVFRDHWSVSKNRKNPNRKTLNYQNIIRNKVIDLHHYGQLCRCFNAISPLVTKKQLLSCCCLENHILNTLLHHPNVLVECQYDYKINFFQDNFFCWFCHSSNKELKLLVTRGISANGLFKTRVHWYSS